MQTRRPETISFERADGSLIAVPPLTRGQIDRVYRLGDCAGMSPAEEHAWRGELLGIYLEQAACTDGAGAVQTPAEAIATLTRAEEDDVILGVVAAQHGHDPANAVELSHAMAALLKKKLKPDPAPK